MTTGRPATRRHSTQTRHIHSRYSRYTPRYRPARVISEGCAKSLTWGMCRLGGCTVGSRSWVAPSRTVYIHRGANFIERGRKQRLRRTAWRGRAHGVAWGLEENRSGGLMRGRAERHSHVVAGGPLKKFITHYVHNYTISRSITHLLQVPVHSGVRGPTSASPFLESVPHPAAGDTPGPSQKKGHSRRYS